jgi:hypothetical protein
MIRDFDDGAACRADDAFDRRRDADMMREDRAIVSRSRAEVPQSELVTVECGKCGDLVRARPEDVAETLERRRRLGIQVYYRCGDCR